jgi:hypothetical protein
MEIRHSAKVLACWLTTSRLKTSTLSCHLSTYRIETFHSSFKWTKKIGFSDFLNIWLKLLLRKIVEFELLWVMFPCLQVNVVEVFAKEFDHQHYYSFTDDETSFVAFIPRFGSIGYLTFIRDYCGRGRQGIDAKKKVRTQTFHWTRNWSQIDIVMKFLISYLFKHEIINGIYKR